MLHVIDDVLIPLQAKSSASIEIYNPDAWQFLTHSEQLDIGSHRVRSFRQRVVMNKKERIYSEAGGHTFFVPVEEGFKVSWSNTSLQYNLFFYIRRNDNFLYVYWRLLISPFNKAGKSIQNWSLLNVKRLFYLFIRSYKFLSL